jgi:broad specificity phosphatase PhoE
MSKTVVHLLRHGEVFNTQKVIYERLPNFHLSDTGYKMAEEVSEFLQNSIKINPDIIYSSPMLRTIETVTPFANAVNMEIIEDDRLLESTSKFAGQRIGHGDASLLHISTYQKLYNPFAPSWGESYVNIATRMRDIIKEKINEHPDQEILMVSHQTPICITRRNFEGKSLAHNPGRRICGLASLTSLVFDTDTQELLKIYYRPNPLS